MYSDIIEKLDFDRSKYILVGYFIRKIREDGQYPAITDLGYFMSSSIFRQDWRRRVLEEKERICTVCGKDITGDDDLFVVYRGGCKAILKKYNIKTIEQAVRVEALWHTDRGDIRCRAHINNDKKKKTKKEKETEKVGFNPSVADAKYIRDYIKADGFEVMAHYMNTSEALLKAYCRKHGIIEKPYK